MQKTRELQAIEKIVGNKKKAKKKLLEIFIRQASQQIEQLQTCLPNSDWKEIIRLAHKMKSTFIIADMPEAKALADAIGNTAGINLELTTQQVNALITICSRVITEFKKELKKIS